MNIELTVFWLVVAVGLILLGIEIGERRERSKLPNDNVYRWDLARHLYGNDAARQMRECDEAHFGDECPLCTQHQEPKS